MEGTILIRRLMKNIIDTGKKDLHMTFVDVETVERGHGDVWRRKVCPSCLNDVSKTSVGHK